MDVKFPHVPTATLFEARSIRRVSIANWIDIGGDRHWIMLINSLWQHQDG